MNTILSTLFVMGGLGVLFGLLLSYAGVKFKTEVDPKLESLKKVLPGVNCGGCGRAGCGAFADDLFHGNAEVTDCPVVTPEVNQTLSDIMGVEAVETKRMVAFVKCIGTECKYLYKYQGVEGCRSSARLANGGSKACTAGCIGNKSCMPACKFGAMRLENGITVIDSEKCTGCKMCIDFCPKKLIEMVPYDKIIRIGCNTHDGAKSTRENCTIGCIGCKICMKKCENGAITMDGTLAKIDYKKCNNCGACIDACPRKCISNGVI
ncbi:MAG: 4Fe-4S binding protein [Defluviitaleaceae bacterium]|nr:4Fe-4S binding protein [Defluviitaleaceae bacterium]